MVESSLNHFLGIIWQVLVGDFLAKNTNLLSTFTKYVDY